MSNIVIKVKLIYYVMKLLKIRASKMRIFKLKVKAFYFYLAGNFYI